MLHIILLKMINYTPIEKTYVKAEFFDKCFNMLHFWVIL